MIGENFITNLNLLVKISGMVCSHFKVKDYDLSQEKISKENMRIRQIIIYLYYNKTIADRLSLTTIAAYFGGMKLENITNAVQTIYDLMEVDKDFEKQITKLKIK